MKQKNYETPNLTVVNIQVEHLMAGSVKSNVGLKGGNAGGNGPARSRQFDSDWDSED